MRLASTAPTGGARPRVAAHRRATSGAWPRRAATAPAHGSHPPYRTSVRSPSPAWEAERVACSKRMAAMRRRRESASGVGRRRIATTRGSGPPRWPRLVRAGCFAAFISSDLVRSFHGRPKVATGRNMAVVSLYTSGASKAAPFSSKPAPQESTRDRRAAGLERGFTREPMWDQLVTPDGIWAALPRNVTQSCGKRCSTSDGVNRRRVPTDVYPVVTLPRRGTPTVRANVLRKRTGSCSSL